MQNEPNSQATDEHPLNDYQWNMARRRQVVDCRPEEATELCRHLTDATGLIHDWRHNYENRILICVALPPGFVADFGRWDVEDSKSRPILGSDDFYYDASMRVTGDFADGSVQVNYMQWLAALLNHVTSIRHIGRDKLLEFMTEYERSVGYSVPLSEEQMKLLAFVAARVEQTVAPDALEFKC